MARSWLPRSPRGLAFLLALALCVLNTVFATSPLPPASLYGSLVSNLSTPFEHDAFVQLAAPYMTELNSPITRNGSFSFTDLKVGDYVLSVHSRLAQFQLYAVSVTPSHQVDVRIYLVGQGPTKTKPFSQPLLLPALQLTSYSTLPTPFSPLTLLKSNPSLLLGLLAFLSLILLPKLLARLDPETANEVNKTQAELHAKWAALAALGSGTQIRSDRLTQSLSKTFAAAATSSERDAREEEREGEVEGLLHTLPKSSTRGVNQNQGTPTGKAKGGKKRK